MIAAATLSCSLTPVNASVTALPPDPVRLELFPDVISGSEAVLGVSLEKDPAAIVVEKIDATIVQIVFGQPNRLSRDEDQAVTLGSLWGELMVRECGWSWLDVQIGSHRDVGVVSPAQDMIIYPFTFVGQCLAKRRVCTVALSFTALLGKKGEIVYKPGGYENVMNHIHHVIPPYTLDHGS